MSGSTRDNAADPKAPSDNPAILPADGGTVDPEALPPAAIPPDLENRTLIDEDGPF